MSALPVFKRFTIQDIPKAPEWVDNIFSPLNLFCEGTVNALNKNLVFGQNVQGQKFSTQFTTLPTYNSGNFTPITLQYTGGGVPTCLLIGNIATTNATLITSPSSVTSWSVNINVNPINIQIAYISGLSNSTQYKLTLLAL